MSWGGPGFVLAIIAIVVIGRMMKTAIRARHGVVEDDNYYGKARRDDLDADRKTSLLAGENERLARQIARLEERIAVLERIATDQPTRLAREIDALR